jgi:uncharacterized membrane protein
MKILKYLLYGIGVLFILFFALGLMKPQVKYGHEITVDKSIKEAWAVTQDETKNSEWLEGFKSIELISGDKGAVGSKYKVVVNSGEDQEDFVMTETIVSLVENEHITLHFDSDMMDFDQTISFREADGKAIVKTESTVSGKGIIMRSMFATMQTIFGTFQSQEEKNINALQKVINENTKDYFPTPVVTDIEMVHPQ